MPLAPLPLLREGVLMVVLQSKEAVIKRVLPVVQALNKAVQAQSSAPIRATVMVLLVLAGLAPLLLRTPGRR